MSAVKVEPGPEDQWAQLRPLLHGPVDPFAVVTALHRCKRIETQELLCNRLYDCTPKQLEFFVPQLCNMLLYKTENVKPLLRFLLDQCRNSLHIGIRIYLTLFSTAQDNLPDTVDKCKLLADEAKWQTIFSSKDFDMGQVVRMYARLQQDRRLAPGRPSPSAEPLSFGNAHPPSPALPAAAVTAPAPHTDELPANVDLLGDFTADKYHALKKTFLFTHQTQITHGLPPAPLTNQGSDYSSFSIFSDLATRGIDTALERVGTAYPGDSLIHFSKNIQKLVDRTCAITTVSPQSEWKTLFQEIRDWDGSRDALKSNYSKREDSIPKHDLPIGSPPISAPPRAVVQPRAPSTMPTPNDIDLESMLRRYRQELFFAELDFLGGLTAISSLLKSLNLKTKEAKNAALRLCLREFNLDFPRGVYHKHDGKTLRIIRIPFKEALSLNSREKVPYMLFLEVVSAEEEEVALEVTNIASNSLVAGPFKETLSLSLPRSTPPDPDVPTVVLREPMTIIDEWVVVDTAEPETPPTVIDQVFGETWAKRKERVRKSSPVGSTKNWDLLTMIIKSGDDLRQEQLATQLIRVFHDIFVSENLPLWVKPYEVFSTSADGGYIETVHDAISLHSLKQELGEDSSLRSYFIKAFGDKTPRFIEAQRNFAESLAAYSLICYLLQIKDRHNGNILLDREGHVIHIDYGFMLSSSPGSLNFETAPFKLTIEFVEVMGGRAGSIFAYFTTVLSSGFLAIRKNAKKIISLVEMLLPGTNMACFAKGPNTIKELEDRFQLQLSEAQAIEFAYQLVAQSVGNWRTDSYDTYQRYFSGIAT